MLSAETAVGEHPIRSVDMMDRIIKQTEKDPAYSALLDAGQAKPRRTTADTITESAKQAAITLPAVAIITFHQPGGNCAAGVAQAPAGTYSGAYSVCPCRTQPDARLGNTFDPPDRSHE